MPCPHGTQSHIHRHSPPTAPVAVVNQIAAYYKEQGCDSILAVGGGSVIDTAKGVRMVISQNTDDIESLMGCEVLTAGRHIPFLAVPTTAGTGSEVTPVAVISNPQKQVKQEYLSGASAPGCGHSGSSNDHDPSAEGNGLHRH